MCSLTSVGSDPLATLLSSFKQLAVASNKSKASASKVWFWLMLAEVTLDTWGTTGAGLNAYLLQPQ